MQRKVDNIQKQVSTYKDKDNVNIKELNSLRTELNRNKDLLEAQALKLDSVQTKNLHLHNEVVALKNKLAICEKTNDSKGERGVEAVRTLVIKVSQLSTYKADVRRTRSFQHWSQEELARLFEKELSAEESTRLFEFCRERGQAKVSNWGLM